MNISQFISKYRETLTFVSYHIKIISLIDKNHYYIFFYLHQLFMIMPTNGLHFFLKKMPYIKGCMYVIYFTCTVHLFTIKFIVYYTAL